MRGIKREGKKGLSIFWEGFSLKLLEKITNEKAFKGTTLVEATKLEKAVSISINYEDN